MHKSTRFISSRHDAFDPVSKIAMRFDSDDAKSFAHKNSYFSSPQHMHLHALFCAGSRCKRHHISKTFDDRIASRRCLDKSTIVFFKHELSCYYFYKCANGANYLSYRLLVESLHLFVKENIKKTKVLKNYLVAISGREIVGFAQSVFNAGTFS